jgi:hypothetical protein
VSEPIISLFGSGNLLVSSVFKDRPQAKSPQTVTEVDLRLPALPTELDDLLIFIARKAPLIGVTAAYLAVLWLACVYFQAFLKT